MADLGSLFGSVVTGNGASGNAPASSAPAANPAGSIGSLFPKVVTGSAAPTPPPAPVPNDPITSTAKQVAASVPAPVTPPSFLSKVGSFISDTFGKAETAVGDAALGPDPNDIASNDAIGSKSSLNRTLSFLPSSIAGSLPFGIGSVFSGIQNDPASAGNITLKDTLGGVPTALKDTSVSLAKGLASVATTVAGVGADNPFAQKIYSRLTGGGKLDGNISVTIPGLGKVDNEQLQVVDKVNAGEDPVQASLETGADAIFNTLFFVDLAGAPFRAGATKVAEFHGQMPEAGAPEGTAIDQGPTIVKNAPATPTAPGAKSFRLYERPSTSAPLPPRVLSLMQDQGVDFGKNFDPQAPTFFRVSQTPKGGILGEVMQVKPSAFDRIVSSFKGSGAEAEGTPPSTPADLTPEQLATLSPSDLTSFHSQEVDPAKAEEALKSSSLELTALSATDAHNVNEARTRLDAGVAPAEITKELATQVGDDKAKDIVAHAQVHAITNPATAPATPDSIQEAIQRAKESVSAQQTDKESSGVSHTVESLLAPRTEDEGATTDGKVLADSEALKDEGTTLPVSHETSEIEHYSDEKAPSFRSPTGTYFAPKDAGDPGFGENRFNRHIKPDANIITPGNSFEVMEKRGLLDTPDSKLARLYGEENNTLRKLLDNESDLDNPNDAIMEVQKRAVKILKRENPDAHIIKFEDEDDLNPTQYVVLKKEALSETPTKVSRGTKIKSKDVIEGFKGSAEQKEVGKIGDKKVVIGTFGKNAIDRKTEAGKEDRLPESELADTLKHLTGEEYKAGDSSFRKDNVVHIAKMPDGEYRAVVTRENAEGDDEVINFFKIGKPIEGFIENLKQFGTPERIRTSSDDVRTVEANPNGGGEETIPRSEQVASKAPVYNGAEGLTTNVLEKLKGRSTVSKTFIENLIKNSYIRTPERALFERLLIGEPDTISVKDFADRVATELLPLTVKASDLVKPDNKTYYDPRSMVEEGNFTPDYVNRALSKEERGKVATYKENIYESPIDTSADIHHFPYKTKNYFAHTRIEDMNDGETRRVLEAQSDLFQKDRLDEEYGNFAGKSESEGMENYSNRVQERDQEVSKLEPYKNTWQERIIDEEVKRAATDEKTKLLFPTGETAMKIEGLSEPQSFMVEEPNALYDLDMESLKEGINIVDRAQQRWTVAHVLGDGQFIGVPTNKEVTIRDTDGHEFTSTYKDATPEQQNEIIDAFGERFNISGKIDQESPIYKFYERELAKYLTKQYGATPVTDAQGVTWNQVDVPAAKATDPLFAFGRAESMLKPEKAPKPPKERPVPMQGFINPGVIVDDIKTKSKEVGDFLEKTQKAVELSDDVDLNLRKLQGANQADLEQVAKLAKKLVKVDAADNEALYHKAEEALNPNAKPAELTPRQQELYDEYDQPFAQANKQLAEKIKKAGFGIPNAGYIHRVPKDYKTAVDALINPKEKEEARLAIGGLLTKSSTSFKHRTMMALEDEAGNRRVVSIKNSEYTVEKGKREGDVIRSKRVTGFGDDRKPVDIGTFRLKTNAQLMESETKPLQKKLQAVQKTMDGLKMMTVKEPLSKGRVEALENEVKDLADGFDAQFASGAFSSKDLRPILKSIRTRENELRILKTVKPAERLSNQGARIEALYDDMRELSNKIAEIEDAYNGEDLDQKFFTDKDGKEWRIVQATTKEIEAQTNTEYHHNALASRIVQYLELNRISRAIDFIENFKTDPRFADAIVEDTGQRPPDGFKRTTMPQFRTYYLESRTADVFDNFYNYMRPNEGLLEEGLDAVGHFLVNSIFYNPIAHPLNVANLWLVDRGGTILAPGRYKAAVTAFAKAFTAVSQKNDDYTYALLHGAPIMNTSTNRSDLAQQLYDVLSSNIDSDIEASKTLAQKLGFQSILDMKKSFGKAWHGATWIPNDILTLQAIYERQATKGMTFEEAVQETGRFIPDYRMPSRILGSRKVSETLQDRGLLGSVWFAMAYHYGEMRSIAAIAKDIAIPKSGFTKEGMKERGDVIGKALMLALLATVVYTALDKMWQKVTGNPNTYVSRSGSVKVVADAMEIAEGQADYTKLLQAELGINPAYEGTLELMFNTDFYTRNPLFGYPPAEGAVTFGESIFAPAAAASRMSPEDFALSLLNVHTPKNSPGKSAAQAQMYDELPVLQSQVKKEIASGDTKVADAQMAEFNQRLATNYQQALIQEGQPPATPAQVKAFVQANGIKPPGAVAMANADKIYADNQVAGKTDLIHTVVTYAKAIGTDPATAFERIFTGQTILDVTSDKVIITARMPLAASEAIRSKQGAARGLTAEELSGMQLDHVIPIASGGSNDESNLSLIPTAQNQVGEQHDMETFLAKAVKQGLVSPSKVKEISIRYKGGKGEQMSPSYTDAYKNDYGSKPMTLQDIYDLVNSGKAK